MKNYISAPNLLLCSVLAVYSGVAQRVALNNRDVTGVTSLYELCPYTDYCTSNATDKLEDKTKTPCCGYCSCADDCWERKNCCEDKQIITAARPLETCESVGINSNQKLNWGYYVIKSCPTEESSLAKKCSGEPKTSLEDLIWVTDKRTKKIYGNKHCALCHGVADYSLWQVATDCVEVMNGQNSPNEVVKSFMNKCRLTVEPPSKEDHTDNTCLIPDIMECNVTGQWDVYDQTLETACNSFQQFYIHEILFKTVIYGNIFCFLCNSKYPLVSDVCLPIKYKGRTTSTRFMGLLDFNKIERKTEVEEKADPVCAVNEIKDPFQHRCLKLSCPQLQSPVHGQCVRLLSGTRFLGVSAVLVFNPVWVKTNTAFKGFSFDFEKVARNLSSTVGQKFGPCKPCEEAVFATYINKTAAASGNMVPEWFSISLLFYTTKRCQENLIIERINQLLGKEIKLQFGQEYMTLIISATTKEEYNQYVSLEGDMLSISAKCPMYIFTDFQKLSSCPSVSLNLTDYTTLMNSTTQMAKKRLIDSLFKQTEKEGKTATNTENNVAANTDNFKVEVCFETYLSVLPKKNHGFSCSPLRMVLLVVVMISSLFGA